MLVIGDGNSGVFAGDGDGEDKFVAFGLLTVAFNFMPPWSQCPKKPQM